MRYYTKSNPDKPERLPDHPAESDEVAASSTMDLKDAGSKYRKEEGFLIPKSFFVIVSGGEARERDYFKVLSDKDRFERIKLEFVADPKQLNPDGLLSVAKFKQDHYKTSQESEPDQIHIVSDVDHFINDLIRIKPECHSLNINLIISNSCFEVWLYYGRFTSKPDDFELPRDYLKISRNFKTYLGRRAKGGINPKTAIFDISNAINNARNNYYEDKNGIPELFSTNMFVLAESILPFVCDELDGLKSEIEAKRRFHAGKRH